MNSPKVFIRNLSDVCGKVAYLFLQQAGEKKELSDEATLK